MGDPLLTPGEVAHDLRVDPKTVTRWAAAHKIPECADGSPGVIYTPGRHCRIKAEAVELIKQGRQPGWTRQLRPGMVRPETVVRSDR